MPKPPDIRSGRQASPRTNWRRRRARTTGDAPYLSARPSRLSTSYRRAVNANTTPQKNASPAPPTARARRALFARNTRGSRRVHRRTCRHTAGRVAAIPKHTEGREFAKAAKSAEQARRQYGKIKKAGLAKQSWSVARALIASRNGNIKHGLAKGGDVRGYVREIVTGPNQRVEALLENNLKYITEATPEAVVDDAMRAATRTIDGIIKDAVNKASKI